MDQLIMMSNKSGKKSNKNNRVNNIPSNLFISWNKDDNICIPLKMKNTTKNKNLSSKKIKIPAFPILEDSKKNKRLSSSVKLLETENSYLIPKIKKIDSEQTKINNILPKINSNSAKAIASINSNDRKRKSFSYFKDNKNAINSVNINNNLNSHSKKKFI